MNYGYFDEVNKEYVITRPDTPAPWANYLGSPAYGAIISNNAGGYSFVKSGANGRILRYHFNSDDTPGRYIYLRDDETKDYWSASWQPVAILLCRIHQRKQLRAGSGKLTVHPVHHQNPFPRQQDCPEHQRERRQGCHRQQPQRAFHRSLRRTGYLLQR